jgi:N-acetylglucosamine repressor
MSKVHTKNRIRRNLILRALLERREISLSELARETGISLPMVSQIVASERGGRFIRTREEHDLERAGRPPILARLNGEAGFVIGIDMGHLNTNIVVLNLAKEVVAEGHVASAKLGNDPRLIDWLKRLVSNVVSEQKLRMERLMGVGISLPGIVRGREGVSESYMNFDGKPVRDVLQDRFEKPVHVEHDAKAMALGERWFGAARNVRHALCLNVGWGLGLGIIVEGRLLYGRDGYAGEFGHIEAVRNGRLCYCGRRGCLETVASGRAIAALAKERLGSGAESQLSLTVGGNFDKVNTQLVVEAALSGDQFSIELLDEVGRYLGTGVATLINLFNPEVVVVGGRVAGAGNYILNPIRTGATQQSHVKIGRDVKFVISQLGSKAGALGVAMLAARDLFEVEHLNPSAYV